MLKPKTNINNLRTIQNRQSTITNNTTTRQNVLLNYMTQTIKTSHQQHWHKCCGLTYTKTIANKYKKVPKIE